MCKSGQICISIQHVEVCFKVFKQAHIMYAHLHICNFKVQDYISKSGFSASITSKKSYERKIIWNI